MKKLIFALTIVLSAMLGINQSAFAANQDHQEVTALTNISRIDKIEVHGNVELYLSDGATDQVKVYNKYYSENALVQSQDGVLRISSYKTQKLVVWVTVSDLHNLSVYDNAQVVTFGQLSALDMDVRLYNNAYVNLNMNAYTVNIKLNDRAKADLEGTITEAELTYDYSSFLNITNLKSVHMVKKINLAYPVNNEKNSLVTL